MIDNTLRRGFDEGLEIGSRVGVVPAPLVAGVAIGLLLGLFKGQQTLKEYEGRLDNEQGRGNEL